MNQIYQNDYGFVYEYGYNIGLFSALIQMQSDKKIVFNSKIQQRTTSWLEHPDQCFSNFVISFRTKHGIIDEAAFNEIRENLEHIFFYGYLSGHHAMRNYIQSISLYPLIPAKVVYFQINLMDPLNRSLLERDKKQAMKQDIQNAFGYQMEDWEIDYYEKTGHFLRADSIVLLQQGKKYYLLITDNSLNLRHLEGINTPELLLRSLQQIRSELGKKTKFTHLSMDTSGIENIHLNHLLLRYANIVKDKTLVKIVQAGSYAYSFLQFITEKMDLSKEKCDISLMGKTDDDFSIVNFSLPLNGWNHSKERDLLKQCHETYKASRKKAKNERQEIPESSKEILIKNMICNTELNRTELSNFVNKVKGTFFITDRITGFQNTAGKYGDGETLRHDHSACVETGLRNNDHNILYLTGNPGIGKTTAIVDELKKQQQFLFLYTSCRRTVNDEILLKFQDGEHLFADDLIALNTSSADETVIKGSVVNVVNYTMNFPNQLMPSSKLKYLNKNRIRNYKESSVKFRTIGDNEFVEDIQIRTGGVLKRLCAGIQEQMENPNIKKIVGTFAIQALKRTNEQTTIQHILRLFPFIRYSEEMGISIDEGKFDVFVEKYPVVWIMIDEITGTDEGIHLYQFLKKWLFEDIYTQLDRDRQEKWNLKFIVADASITNEKIINQCLHKYAHFDHSKIYVTSVDEELLKPLETKEILVPISGGNIKGLLVNTNSYPAKELNLTYHISVQGISRDEYFASRRPKKERDKQERNLSEEQDEMILRQIFNHLKEYPDEQVIVYIQDINRLEKLKNKFIQRYSLNFNQEALEYAHYMSITSQLTTKARAQALSATEKVRCVFMTSSASRGISFKKATKILAVLQTFNIERELMEQIQLYYRMRGDNERDTTRDKHIEFFVVDSYVHNGADEEFHKSKTVIHLLSFLTLVRACLESRIFGKCEIGKRSLSVVPLGGSGISPVKNSLIQDIADSMKLITKELAGKERFKLLLELKEEFNSVFGKMKVQTYEQIFRPGFTAKNIYDKFLGLARYNLSKLIHLQPFYPFLFSNGLLLFPVKDYISEKVSFRIHERECNIRLIRKIEQALMEDITDDLRKKLIHILDLLEFEIEQQGQLPNKYVEKSSDEKRYVAFPLLAFTMFEELKEYDSNGTEDTFLEAIQDLARARTNVSSVTPISGKYKNIPFITFKSDALEEMFESRFKQNYLLTSTETNILNLLLME